MMSWICPLWASLKKLYFLPCSVDLCVSLQRRGNLIETIHPLSHTHTHTVAETRRCRKAWPEFSNKYFILFNNAQWQTGTDMSRPRLSSAFLWHWRASTSSNRNEPETDQAAEGTNTGTPSTSKHAAEPKSRRSRELLTSWSGREEMSKGNFVEDMYLHSWI